MEQVTGIDAGHKKGRKGGRPIALTTSKLATLKSLKKNDNFSVKQICELVGITRSVYYRALKQHEDLENG